MAKKSVEKLDPNEVNRRKGKDLYADGMEIAKIAEELNAGLSTVQGWSAADKWVAARNAKRKAISQSPADSIRAAILDICNPDNPKGDLGKFGDSLSKLMKCLITAQQLERDPTGRLNATNDLVDWLVGHADPALLKQMQPLVAEYLDNVKREANGE
jgi:hypothetical protein